MKKDMVMNLTTTPSASNILGSITTFIITSVPCVLHGVV